MSGVIANFLQLISTSVFWWSCLLLAAVTLSYVRVSRWVWLGVFVALLVAYSVYGHLSPLWARVLAWPVFFAPWIILAIPAVRRPLISRGVLEHLRARLPELTRAELTTVQAGNVWWEGAFFAGAPRWREIADSPAAVLTETERRFVARNVSSLCVALDELQHESVGISVAMLARTAKEKFFALNIPPLYGGLGFSRGAASAVLTRLATRYPAVSLTLASALAPAELILRYGSEEQKDKWLPVIATGECLGALALSGLEAVNDLSAMEDEAVVFRRDEGLAVRLNFRKRYVTLAARAKLLIVAARLSDPEQLLGNPDRRGITLFLVPTSLAGVQTGARHRSVDHWLEQGPVTGHDVVLSLDQLVGGPDAAGLGWKMLTELHATMRLLGVPSVASGAAKTLSRVAGAYARMRFQFGEPIGFLPGVQELLARIGGQTYCLEAVRRVSMSAYSAGKEPAVIASIAKYQSAERLRAVVADAIEIQGGKALCCGPANLLEPFLNLASVTLSIDGTNLVSRNLTIYGQGLIRSHPFVARELEAVRDTDRLRGEEQFDALFGQHIAFAASNAVKTLLLSVAGGRLARSPSRAGWTRRWYRRLSRMSAAFALCNDVLLAIFGGDLKSRQKESARLADILGLLYVATATLKFYRERGSEPADQPLVDYALHDSLWQIQSRFDALFANLPSLSGWIMRRIVFPFGMPYRRQPDPTEQAAARILLVPSGARNRLTAGVCLPADTESPMGILEQAHARVVEDKPLYRKLREARNVRLISGHNISQWLESALQNNVIDHNEAARLRETERLRQRVIAVDDYPAE